MATESRTVGGSRLERLTRDRDLALPLLVGGGVLLAFAVRLSLAFKIATPWIMLDELIYSELAKNFAEHGEFLLRDQASGFNNIVYPALISPAWLADPVSTAYRLAQAVNVALMLLAVLPVWFWARRLMSEALALVPVVLVLLMPAQIYSGMLMTENAFFVSVVTALFLVALTLERPTLTRQALVLVAVGVAYFVRPQAIVLLPVYLGALVLKLLLDLRAPGGPRGLPYVFHELRRYLPSAVVAVLAAVAYAAIKARQGLGLESGLGAYGGVAKVDYDLTAARSYVLHHFAELTFSVAVVPVSALILLVVLAFRGYITTAAERAFLAVATAAFILMVVEVGVFASRFALRIEERNLFSVVPLLFIALALWVERGLPRPLVTTLLAALVPAALLLTLDLPSLLNIGILSDTFGLIPLLRLNNWLSIDTVKVLLCVGGLAAALAFVFLPRRLAALALPGGVALFLVLSSYAVYGAVRDQSKKTLALTTPSEPSWIDDEIGTDAHAAYLYGSTSDLVGEAQIMWQTEFWNRSLDKVFSLAPGSFTLAETPAALNPATGAIAAPGLFRYVAVPSTLQLAGELLALRPPLALYRVAAPARLAGRFDGVYRDGWMGADASYTRYAGAAPGLIRVRVSRLTWHKRSTPARLTIRVVPLAGGAATASAVETVGTGDTRTVTLRTPKPPYRVEVHAAPTFSPTSYGEADSRQLGAELAVSAPP